MNDNTIKFVVPDEADQEMKALLTTVYSALSEKGYNPINQIVGYLLSDRPDLYHELQKRQKPHLQGRPRRAAAGAGPALSVRLSFKSGGLRRLIFCAKTKICFSGKNLLYCMVVYDFCQIVRHFSGVLRFFRRSAT